MIELLVFVVIIALIAYVVSLLLGQPAGLITFVILLLVGLLALSGPSSTLHLR